eukprot:TRINITY_DN9032_c0_g1_i1.p1 TRINITY_DN9032_c0_g1~~TRINITY_DN9032_c0_g1_i1.p1  ORF type:complete len:614 (+),score=168.33 TRINITY_DN9032_c0_g1_i1:108-1949(+)
MDQRFPQGPYAPGGNRLTGYGLSGAQQVGLSQANMVGVMPSMMSATGRAPAPGLQSSSSQSGPSGPQTANALGRIGGSMNPLSQQFAMSNAQMAAAMQSGGIGRGSIPVNPQSVPRTMSLSTSGFGIPAAAVSNVSGSVQSSMGPPSVMSAARAASTPQNPSAQQQQSNRGLLRVSTGQGPGGPPQLTQQSMGMTAAAIAPQSLVGRSQQPTQQQQQQQLGAQGYSQQDILTFLQGKNGIPNGAYSMEQLQASLSQLQQSQAEAAQAYMPTLQQQQQASHSLAQQAKTGGSASSEFNLVNDFQTNFPALPGFKESATIDELATSSQLPGAYQPGAYGAKSGSSAPAESRMGSSYLTSTTSEQSASRPPSSAAIPSAFDAQAVRPSQPTKSTSPATASKAGPPSGIDRFSLLGLLSVIRMTDPDLNTLALGTDLTTLGLNLNSPEPLYSTFASPWADGPTRREPEYYIPMCYYMQQQLSGTQTQNPLHKMSLFSDETLFYIFYSMPRDILQAAAAAELYKRDWRFHKEHKLWFARVAGTEPVLKTGTHEKGSYIYYDITQWDRIRKDNFILAYNDLESSPPAIIPTAKQQAQQAQQAQLQQQARREAQQEFAQF